MKQNQKTLAILWVVIFMTAWTCCVAEAANLTSCFMDIDGDKDVDGKDTGEFLQQYGAENCLGACTADSDGNGVVNAADLPKFTEEFGRNDCVATPKATENFRFNDDPESNIIADAVDGDIFFTFKGEKAADNTIVSITEIFLMSTKDYRQTKRIKLDGDSRPISFQSPDGEVVLEYLPDNKISVTSTSSDGTTVETEIIDLPADVVQALQSLVGNTVKSSPTVLINPVGSMVMSTTSIDPEPDLIRKSGSIFVECDDGTLPTAFFTQPAAEGETAPPSQKINLDIAGLADQVCAAGKCTNEYEYHMVVKKLPPKEVWEAACKKNVEALVHSSEVTTFVINRLCDLLLPGGFSRFLLYDFCTGALDWIVNKVSELAVCTDGRYEKLVDELNKFNKVEITVCKGYQNLGKGTLQECTEPVTVNDARTEDLPVFNKNLGPAPPSAASIRLKLMKSYVTGESPTIPKGAMLEIEAVDNYKDLQMNQLDSCANYSWTIVKQLSSNPPYKGAVRKITYRFKETGTYNIALDVIDPRTMKATPSSVQIKVVDPCETLENVTWKGREWQECGSTSMMNQDQAIAYCDSLVENGHDDWFLPSIGTLSSLIVCTNGVVVTGAVVPHPSYGLVTVDPVMCDSVNQYTYYRPTIDPIFGMRSYNGYWSSTIHYIDPKNPDETRRSGAVSFDYGWSTVNQGFFTNYFARCVRGGP